MLTWSGNDVCWSVLWMFGRSACSGTRLVSFLLTQCSAVPSALSLHRRYIRSTLIKQTNASTDFVESLTLTAHCVGASRPQSTASTLLCLSLFLLASLPANFSSESLCPPSTPRLPPDQSVHLSVPPADTCNDGIQNFNETGIDCGGPCSPCQDLHLDELAERNQDLAKDLAALRMKIAAEQKAKEERDQENKVAKVAISFMIVLGAAIVLGGPIIYSLKRGKASGGVGPMYQQVARRPQA